MNYAHSGSLFELSLACSRTGTLEKIELNRKTKNAMDNPNPRIEFFDFLSRTVALPSCWITVIREFSNTKYSNRFN